MGYFNILFGTKLCQYLPTVYFDENEIPEGNEDNLLDTKNDHRRGCFIEWYLEIQQNIHFKNEHFFVQRRKQKKENFFRTYDGKQTLKI